jgi:hypothetical protein
MTGTNNDIRPAGLLIGSMIALSFGTSFVMANSGGLSSPWPLIIRVVGALIAVALAIQVIRVVRSTTVVRQGAAGFTDRRYWWAVIGEVIALFGGLYVINQVLEKPDVAIAWVAVVVGVHFFPLGWAWRMPLYYRLGTVMTALGVAGFVAYAFGASAATVALISGVGSGFALYATVAAGLRDTGNRMATASAAP